MARRLIPIWQQLATLEQERAALADEQAAFRRVATFVAQDPPAGEIFATVAAELGRLLGAQMTHLHRYEGERRWTVVGGWSTRDHLALGLEWTDDGGLLERSIVHDVRPTRIDDYELAMISIAPELQRLGARSSVGAPIVVDGRVWGMIAASSRGEPLPQLHRAAPDGVRRAGRRGGGQRREPARAQPDGRLAGGAAPRRDAGRARAAAAGRVRRPSRRRRAG